MNANRFRSWFDRESGYSLHPVYSRRGKFAQCCGGAPAFTGKGVREYDPVQKQYRTLPLTQCPVCRRWYLQRDDGWYERVENLLRYPVVAMPGGKEKDEP